MKVSLNVARQKTKNLAANPAVTVFILDPANPARYVEIRGDATLDPDDDYAFRGQSPRRQVRRGLTCAPMDGPDGRRVVVTVDPVRINAIDLSV